MALAPVKGMDITMMRIAIVDDEELHLDILEEIIMKYFSKYQYTLKYRIYRYGSGLEFLKCT